MPKFALKLIKIVLLVAAAGGFYFLAAHTHAQREAVRQTPVALTPACAEKLARYGLAPSDQYRSP